MKRFIRALLISLIAIWLTSQILPGLVIVGGFKSLIVGAFIFMVINLVVVPLLKLMFLPLNLLTFGLFSWVVNVLALYVLTSVWPLFQLVPFYFEGANLGLIIFPAFSLNVLQVAIGATVLISLISNTIKWLIK